MSIAVIAIIVAALSVAVAMAIREIRDINLRLTRLSDAVTLGHDTRRLCELTTAMVLEEVSKPRVKSRPLPSHLTIIKGPKQ